MTQGFQGSGIKEDEDVSVAPPPRRGPPRPTKTTTAIPIDVTTVSATTRRPPRVKSNILLAGKQNSGGRAGQNKNKAGQRVFFTTTPVPFAEDDLSVPPPPPLTPESFDTDSITDDRSTDPFRNPPVLSADGKKPRVKSNIKANKAQVGASLAGVNDLEKGRHKVEIATENIQFVSPSLEDHGLGDVSVDNGPVPGPEVRPDGRPPRVKANIQSNNNNKFNGQKDQRTRIPVSTEIPVEFELGTDVPVIPQDFLPPPAAPEETPFSSIPTGQDFKPQNNLFNQPAESFTTRRPEGPRVKSNILANQRNKGGNSGGFGNAKPRPKITVPIANEDTRSTGDRVVPVNDLASPSTIPPGVQNFLAQVPVAPLDQAPAQPQFIDEIDEFEEPEVTTFVPPTPQPGPIPRVKSNILASRQNKFNNNNNRNQVGQRPAPVQTFSSESGSAENEPVFDGQVEDGPCSNPFKCPPSKVADGRKPRVKSNIKAVHRNFFVPNRSNRIKGKVKPERNQLNQFLTNLKGRKVA